MRTYCLLLFAIGILCSPTAALSLDVGDPAPEFTAVSTQGQIQLTDFKEKKNVVLALYFAVFTPV